MIHSYKKLYSKIITKNIKFYNKEVLLNKCNLYPSLKRNFFFKSKKNDIIKNEIEEILQNETLKNELEKDLKVHIEKKEEITVNKKLEENKNKKRKKFQRNKGKFKRLMIFITFQTIPIVGLMYAFKYLEQVKLSELNYSLNTSDDIINEAIKLMSGPSKCFCLFFTNYQINTIFLEPLNYEKAEINYETLTNEKNANELTENKNVINEIENNITNNINEKENLNKSSQHEIEKIIYSINKPLIQKIINKKSSIDLPLNYLYFCISRDSEIYKYLLNNNNITLLYSDDKKCIYVTLNGTGTIINNQEIKNIMWNNKWSYLISNENIDQNYILVKFTPYIVSVKTIGLKEEHWKEHVVKRSINNDNISWIKIH